MNPLYYAALAFVLFIILSVFQDDVDDDNDGPGGGIMQPVYNQI